MTSPGPEAPPAAPLPLVAGLHYAGHERQPHPWGCIYRSAVALTGDRDLLEHERDCNVAAALLRLHEIGYLPFAVYRDHRGVPVDPDFWPYYRGPYERHQEANPDGLSYSLVLLGVPSLTYPGLDGLEGRGGHTVGAVFCVAGVVVLDPGRPAEQRMTWPEFEASPYALAFEVFELQPGDVALHEPIDGPSMPHVRSDAVRRAAQILESL